MESNRLPNVLIGGVHKAGTTSLHTYLSMHPDVCGSLIKELAFLLPARYGQPTPNDETYEAHFRHCQSHRYRLETTPSYLYGGKQLISEIKLRLGEEVRIIFILRNPVERFISFYRHCVTKMEIPADTNLETFIKQSAPLSEGVRKNDSVSHLTQGLVEGDYAAHLQDWIDAFGDRLLILFFDDLQADTPGVMKRLCQWLKIDYSIYRPDDFAIENRTVNYRLGILHKSALWINHHTETFWRKNIRLKRLIRGLYYSLNEEKKAQTQDTESLKWLEDIYRESNKKLLHQVRQTGMTKVPFWLANAG